MRNKRKRKKQEKKPKSDVNPLNKIKQLIGIKVAEHSFAGSQR